MTVARYDTGRAPDRVARLFWKPWLSVAVLLAAAGPAAGIREIGLQQAVDFALKGNRDLKRLAVAVDSEALGLEAAASEFKLTFAPLGRAEASDTVRSAGAGVELARKTTWGTEVGVSGTMSRDAIEDGDTTRRAAVRVTLNQPLLRNAGPLLNREPLRQAERQVTEARRAWELARTDLIVSLAESHENLLRLQRQSEQDRQAVERLRKFLRLTTLREKQGQATRIDSMRAELRLGDAVLRLGETKERLSSGQAQYAELMGFAAEEEFVALPAPRVLVTVANAEEAIGAALSNRLDYAQILQDRADALRGTRIARRALLPDLNLISRFERLGEGSSASEAERLDDSAWFVGLGMSSKLPLRREEAAAGQAELRRVSTDIQVDIVRSGIGRQVRDLLNAYRRAEAEIAPAERNFEVARDRARLARRLFEIGKGDSLSVADAEDEFRAAEGRTLDVQSSLSIAAYRLLRAAGTLVEYPAELKPAAIRQ